MDLSDIAVVVVAKNEEQHLEACLKSVLKNTAAQAEVWFVDDGSTDQTLAIARSFDPDIRILTLGGVGPSRARNEAISQTDRTFIALIDADAIAEEGWLDALKNVIVDTPENASSVGGLQIAYVNALPPEKECIRFLESLGFVSDYIHESNQVEKVTHNPTCNVLYKKSAISRAKGFDENMWPCEDLDLDLRLKKMGYYALYTPQAVVQHRRATHFGSLARMFERYGFGHARLVKRHGMCQPIHYAMVASVLLFSLLCFALFVDFKFWIWAMLALYVALVSVFLSRKNTLLKSIKFSWWLPICILKWLQGFFRGMLAFRGIAKHV